MGPQQDYNCTLTFKDIEKFNLIFESNITYYIQMLQQNADFKKITSQSQQPVIKGGDISRKPSPLLAKNYQKYVSILENVSYVMGIKYIRYFFIHVINFPKIIIQSVSLELRKNFFYFLFFHPEFKSRLINIDIFQIIK